MNYQIADNGVSSSRKYCNDIVADRQPYNILVIDDDTLTLEVVKRIFQSDGHEVVAMNDGEKAVTFLDLNEFDYIYLDVVLRADLSGFDLFELIKDKSDHPKIKFMTGYFLTDQMDRYIKKSDGIVWKPFTRNELLSSLEGEQEICRN